MDAFPCSGPGEVMAVTLTLFRVVPGHRGGLMATADAAVGEVVINHIGLVRVADGSLVASAPRLDNGRLAYRLSTELRANLRDLMLDSLEAATGADVDETINDTLAQAGI